MLDTFFFVFSIVACFIVLYLIALMWFSNSHGSYLKSFTAFGIVVALWILFGAFIIVSDKAHFPMVYTFHVVTVCAFPYIFVWYALHFSKSKLVNSSWVRFLLILCGTAEVLVFLTNPWHHLMFLTYDYPDLPLGPLFGVHLIFSYIATLIAFITIIGHTIRFKGRTPLMIAASISILLPYILNILLALDALGTRRDLTAVGFFVTYTMFFLSSYRSGLFGFQSVIRSSIFTSLADVILIANAQGTIVDYNEAYKNVFSDFQTDLDKTTTAEFLTWLTEYASEISPKDFVDDITNINIPCDEVEFNLTSPDGDSHITYTMRRDLVKQGDGIAGYVLTMTDVSAYRSMIKEINLKNENLIRLNELADQASKAKSEFLANMSHEIRTPIYAISGMSQIAGSTDDLDKIRACMKKVDVANKQLLGIINDILDMSKIEANKMELASEPFDLHATITNVAGIMEVKAAEKELELLAEIGENVPRIIVGDDMRLSQIILNLLSNAVKFTPKNGHIKLSLKQVNAVDELHYFEISVLDDGIGITKEQQNRLFKSFEQAEKGTSRRYGGSGLGLSISKKIAELMGGTIVVDSEPGKYSRFTASFCLPIGREEDMVSAETMQTYNFEGKRALLAEDIAINREILIELLADSKIKIDEAENGQIALEVFKANPKIYDIIFMDIQMPVMDGYEATKLLRSSDIKEAQTVPILAMTANAFSEDAKRCRDIGMNDHIAKPVALDELYRKMDQLINK